MKPSSPSVATKLQAGHKTEKLHNTEARREAKKGNKNV